MPETTEEKQNVIELLKEYISTRIELGRLTVIERVVIIVSNLITDTFVVFSMLLTFLFGSIALGFYFGEVFDSNAKGFGMITLIYFLLALIMYFIKDNYVEKFLHGFIVKRIFKDKK